MAGFMWTRAPYTYSEDLKKPCLGDLVWKFLSVPLFGRYNRAGGDIGLKGLSWNLASFKGTPLVYATHKSEEYGPDARKSNPNKKVVNCNHDLDGPIRM